MITYKSKKELQIMKDAGRILSLTFEEVAKHIKVGISAKALDAIAHKTIESHGAKPGFLGIYGYKYATCISKNEEIVHGIPYEDKIVVPGDIWSIDMGVLLNGYYADAARTFMIEDVSPEIKKLVKITEESFYKAFDQIKPGNRMGDVVSALQNHVESNQLTVVRDLYSHGIGKELHEDPLIPNYGEKGTGVLLKEGMTFALEPMVNIGTADILTCDDKWTIITADRKWSAHYENTVAVTKDGAELLTIHEG